MKTRIPFRCLGLGATILLGACQGAGLGGPAEPPALTVGTPSEPRIAEAAQAELSLAAPGWAVGDNWRYNDGYGMHVESVEAGLTRFRRLDDETQWVSRRGFLREAAQSATTFREIVFRSIGVDQAQVLRQGQPVIFTREYTANGATRVHLTSWVLEGRETITVPAGEFDTYVVVMRTRNAATGWTGFERWWYAPAVRNYVRMEYRYGDSGVGSRVLVSYDVTELPQTASLAPATGIGEDAPAQSAE